MERSEFEGSKGNFKEREHHSVQATDSQWFRDLPTHFTEIRNQKSEIRSQKANKEQ
jgi:hypothetical protein